MSAEDRLGIEEAAEVDPGRLLTFIGKHGRVVRHALNANAAGSEEAVQREGSSSEQAGAQVGHVGIHGDADVFPKEGAGFDVDGFAGREGLGENVAVTVQE